MEETARRMKVTEALNYLRAWSDPYNEPHFQGLEHEATEALLGHFDRLPSLLSETARLHRDTAAMFREHIPGEQGEILAKGMEKIAEQMELAVEKLAS